MKHRYPNLAWLAANAPNRQVAQAILRAIDSYQEKKSEIK